MSELGFDERARIHAPPFVPDEEVVACGKRRDALVEASFEEFWVYLASGLPNDRLYHREQVLGPVIDLAHQEMQMLFVGFALGDVVVERDQTVDGACLVAHRQKGGVKRIGARWQIEVFIVSSVARPFPRIAGTAAGCGRL